MSRGFIRAHNGHIQASHNLQPEQSNTLTSTLHPDPRSCIVVRDRPPATKNWGQFISGDKGERSNCRYDQCTFLNTRKGNEETSKGGSEGLWARRIAYIQWHPPEEKSLFFLLASRESFMTTLAKKDKFLPSCCIQTQKRSVIRLSMAIISSPATTNNSFVQTVDYNHLTFWHY